jgi:hypothetical protein
MYLIFIGADYPLALDGNWPTSRKWICQVLQVACDHCVGAVGGASHLVSADATGYAVDAAAGS